MAGNDEQGLTDPRSARAEHALHPARRGKRGEVRLAPAAAVLVAIVLYAVLPESLLLGPRFLIRAWSSRCWWRLVIARALSALD